MGNIEFKHIGLCITDRCNAECKMCCFSCSPANQMCMEEEKLKGIIDQAADISEIKAIGISGGEAMLYPDLVCNVAEYARSKGLKTSLTTNGFWGKDRKNALAALQMLKRKGIAALSISVDAYHLQYVDIECIRNILISNHEVGIPVTLAVGDALDGIRAYDILRELGQDAYETKIVLYPFLPVGKGKTIEEKHLVFKEYQSSWRCPANGELLIMPNGDTYPCCSQGVYKSILSEGNVFQKPLSQIIDSYKGFCYFSLLQSKGMQWIHEILMKEENANLQERYVSPCHLCNTVFTDENMLEKLKQYYDSQLFEEITNIFKIRSLE